MITYKAKNRAGQVINSVLSPFTFPAGEAHIKREERRQLEDIEIAIIQPDYTSMDSDLVHLLMWSDYLLNTETMSGERIKRVVILPYIPGARADRDNPLGVQVYASIIGLTYPDQLVVFDPHSSAALEELQTVCGELTVLEPADLFSGLSFGFYGPVWDGVVAPDKGAQDRAAGVADELSVPLYTCEKSRDFETGKLNGFTAPDNLPMKGNLLIVDDICDGGGTFVGQAAAIKRTAPEVNLDLYVSHGVFSGQAAHRLSAAFETIITTNSYNPGRVLANEYSSIKRLDIIRPMLARIEG